MNPLEWVKIFKMNNKIENKQKHFFLTHNENDVEKVKVIVNPLVSDTYKQLRKFATPQYDEIFLMRNKRGFNTTFFKQHYDVIVCDKNFRVLKTFTDVNEGYISEHFENGYFIYFATVGMNNFLEIKENDRLRIRRDFLM